MATNNHCNALTQETPVCKFHKKIKEEHKKYQNQRRVSHITIKSLETECNYALSNLEKAEQTFKFYQNLNNFQLFDMVHSAEIIKADIDEQAKTDTGELGKLITAASKSLNDLQVKLHDANNAACSMRNCLQSVLGFKDEGEPCEPVELECVTALAKKLSKNGKDASNAMINVAGIHTFSNLETLQPFANNLIDKLTVLKGQTEKLAETAKKDEQSAQDALTGLVKQLNQEQFEYFHTASKINAHKATLDFICGEQCCPPIDCVDVICKELGNENTEDDKASCLEKDED